MKNQVHYLGRTLGGHHSPRASERDYPVVVGHTQVEPDYHTELPGQLVIGRLSEATGTGSGKERQEPRDILATSSCDLCLQGLLRPVVLVPAPTSAGVLLCTPALWSVGSGDIHLMIVSWPPDGP